MGWRVVVGGVLGLLMSCAPHRVAQSKAGNGSGAMFRPAVAVERLYSDPVFGFELVRPAGQWRLETNDERTPEGVAVPVVLQDEESGAQVVLQIAPAVASPAEFAERLVDGLRSHPGFEAADPEPLEYSEGGMGFDFGLGDSVRGQVAVIEGTPGNIFMLMATWPASSPNAQKEVEAIFRSVRPSAQK